MTAHKANTRPKRDSQADFRNSPEANFRRLYRDLARKSQLTRSEKEVLLAFLNHWFHHRSKGPVHPGRKKLAKRAKVHINTVKATLSLLRDFGAIEATAHLEGLEGNATEYTVDVDRLEALCRTPKAALRKWRAIYRGPNLSGSRADKKCPPSNECNVIQFPSQRIGK